MEPLERDGRTGRLKPAFLRLAEKKGAGQRSPRLEIPSLVIPTAAIRDEGTSYPYLPTAESVDGDAGHTFAPQAELGGLGLTVVPGPVWTTDALYRKTSGQLERNARDGILAVKTKAASLSAFGAAGALRCGVAALVVNGAGRSAASQFDNGTRQLGLVFLKPVCRAGRRCTT